MFLWWPFLSIFIIHLLTHVLNWHTKWSYKNEYLMSSRQIQKSNMQELLQPSSKESWQVINKYQMQASASPEQAQIESCQWASNHTWCWCRRTKFCSCNCSLAYLQHAHKLALHVKLLNLSTLTCLCRTWQCPAVRFFSLLCAGYGQVFNTLFLSNPWACVVIWWYLYTVFA